MSRVPPKKKNLKPEAPPAPAAAAEAAPGSFEMRLLKGLLIVLAGLFVYAPAFHGGWLWDDDQEITANAVLPDPAGLVKIWKGETGADYFPLKATVQWVYFRAFGTNNTAWHLLNVVLHLANALLVWKLLSRLGIRQAWLGGLIFAIHPILVESVAWVSELKNTLSLPFLLLAMLSWINFDERGKPGDYLSTLLFYAAAILCKTSVVMFPFVLLLYSWWRSLQPHLAQGAFRPNSVLREIEETLQRIIPGKLWRALLASLPFFLISLVMGLLTIYFQHGRAIGSETIPVGGLLSRTEIAGVSVWFYLYKTILPFGLLPIYPRWQPGAWMLLSWPLLLALLVWLWTKRRTWGAHALLGIGFFLINLFPILGFIKMSYMRITWAADHFLYLPALGLIGLAAAGLGLIYDRASRHNQPLLAGLGAILFTGLAVMGHSYAGVFANEYEMWTHTLKSNPNAWQAHSRLGKVMLERGANDAAFYHIGESVRLRPDLAETHNNFGAMLEKKGDMEGAVKHLRMAVERAPDIHIYKINLGSLLVRLGKYGEGRAVYTELLKADPNNPTFLCNLGVAQYFLGENDDAIESFQAALKIQPNLKDAQENLQQALKKRYGSAPPSPSLAPPAPGILGGDSSIKLFGN
jgi:tetratricopeptide (TPR) repeat protein